VSCAETLGLGCVAVPIGVGIAGVSNQQMQQGNSAFSGPYQSNEGQRVLDSFNLATYPGERDPLMLIGIDAAKLGLAYVGGKYIPKALAKAEGLETGVANGATSAPAGAPIPANSANAGVGLRNDLSIQAGVPTSTSNIWGASLDDLKQAFNTGGATITPGAARPSSSGNSQILIVEGSSTGVVQVQYSPASAQSTHGGQYYKFTYADGAELKVIDPANYRVLGWPENGGKTTFLNPGGNVITYDPVSKTWR
jgi:hypothetical protein